MAQDAGTDAEAAVRTRGPPFPRPVFNYLINPLVSRLLTSRFHGLASDDLLLVNYTGRRSGREYSVPVGYEEHDGTLCVTSLEDHTWWRNVRGGATVIVYLRGERRGATADVVEEDRAIAEYVQGYVDRHGRDAIERLSITIEGDRWPDTEALVAGLEELVLVRIELDDNRR